MSRVSMLERASIRLRKKSSKSKPAGSVRHDIQGLRAFAVVAVILDHLVGWPSGGFIGVDVFFVISGFLITGLLIREYERTGTISFSGFYRRRIKRILPASTLVLVVTLAASFISFNHARFDGILWDSVWAAVFAGNWRFAATGTDYFEAGGPTSPLQHFWSLAVEEQFYFVWPWVMLLVFALLARIGLQRAARTSVGVVILVISAASFTWAVWETTNNAGVAYFSTLSRTWELGIGAGIAVLAPALTRIPAGIRPILAWIGLAGMTASLFVINGSQAFPAPSAALPVVSTALVILAGSGSSQQKYLAPLTNRVSGYIGDISFSLYLWHFPVIIIGSQFLDSTDVLGLTMMAAVFVLLSVYSFHLLEDPIRKSGWLDGKANRRDRNPDVSQSYKLTALSALAVLTALVVAPTFIPTEKVTTASSATATVAPATDSAAVNLPPKLAGLRAEIQRALAVDSWPVLSPSMDDAISGQQAPPEVVECGQMKQLVNEKRCTWGAPEATKLAVMVGDSTSLTYVAGVRKVIDTDRSWSVKSYGTFGCSFSLIPGEIVDPACEARKTDAIEAVNRLKPDVVFVTNHYNSWSPKGLGHELSIQERKDSVASVVERFSQSGARVVFLAPPPSDVVIEECYSPSSQPRDCITKITEQRFAAAKTEQELAAEIGATFVDSTDWFCFDGLCPSFVGTTPVKLDLNHSTPAYQEKIAPAIVESLKAQAIL